MLSFVMKGWEFVCSVFLEFAKDSTSISYFLFYFDKCYESAYATFFFTFSITYVACFKLKITTQFLGNRIFEGTLTESDESFK